MGCPKCSSVEKASTALEAWLDMTGSNLLPSTALTIEVNGDSREDVAGAIISSSSVGFFILLLCTGTCCLGLPGLMGPPGLMAATRLKEGDWRGGDPWRGGLSPMQGPAGANREANLC